MRPFIAIAAMLLAACSATLSQRAREQFHQMIYTGPLTSLTLDNVAGSARVEGWAKPAVDVEATKYGYDANDLRNIAIVFDATQEGVIAVSTRYAHGVHAGEVRYLIHVPTAASVRVNNTAGAVDVTGVTGSISVQTQTGQIVVDGGLVTGSRLIELRATAGAVKLTAAAASSATVEASSIVGAVSSDFPGVTSQRNLLGAHAAGTIGGGSAEIRLATTTGAITLARAP